MEFINSECELNYLMGHQAHIFIQTLRFAVTMIIISEFSYIKTYY
jgi:hypothetical protein